MGQRGGMSVRGKEGGREGKMRKEGWRDDSTFFWEAKDSPRCVHFMSRNSCLN